MKEKVSESWYVRSSKISCTRLTLCLVKFEMKIRHFLLFKYSILQLFTCK
ncbi:hypothetical protein Leryth_025886 [Lithospermum erythrorhizon]|nr:hypothetical protein Leryth_025886 [Lithospermum erythrorhizon]